MDFAFVDEWAFWIDKAYRMEYGEAPTRSTDLLAFVRQYLVARHGFSWAEYDAMPMAEVVRILRDDAEPSPEHADGPEPPKWFWWGNRRYELPPVQWKLLNVLSGKDLVPIGDVCEAVWGDDDQREGPLKAALTRLNNWFFENQIPLEYGQSRGYIVRRR
jgi:hypothetical protein